MRRLLSRAFAYLCTMPWQTVLAAAAAAMVVMPSSTCGWEMSRRARVCGGRSTVAGIMGSRRTQAGWWT